MTTNIEASLFILYVCHWWSIDIAQMILFMLYFSPHLGSLLPLLESQTVRTVICIIHYHKNWINTQKCSKESLFITQKHHPKFVHWYENLRSHWWQIYKSFYFYVFAILTFMHQTNLHPFLDGFLVLDFLWFVCLKFLFEQKLCCKRNAIYIASVFFNWCWNNCVIKTSIIPCFCTKLGRI